MLNPGWFGLPWLLWVGVCLVVAVIYTVVWPRSRAGQERPTWRHLVLRWSHVLVWLLLALSCLLRALGGDGVVAFADPVALLALAGYLIFLGALTAERWATR